MKNFKASVPTKICNFKEEEKKETVADLKIFYIGQTADKRLFTKEFSEKLLETLPNTPVVAFYSEEKEDFIGHNKIQYAYGHVPSPDYTFEKDEDGNTWAVTQVILYTERSDNIGKIAKKIIGKQHSLEMNPKTLEYKVHKDSNGKIQNIEFTKGTLIGLSVLGDEEEPAFEGSGFFQKAPKELVEKFAKFLELQEQGNIIQIEDTGGEEMIELKDYFKKTQEKICDFISLTREETQERLYKYLQKNEKYGIIKQSSGSEFVFEGYNCSTHEMETKRYTYKFDENLEVIIEKEEEVFARYFNKEEVEKLEEMQNQEEGILSNAEELESISQEGIVPANNTGEEENANEDTNTNTNGNENIQENPVTENVTSTEENDEGEATNEEGQVEEEQMGEAKTGSDITALLESQRIELEKYRRKEKIELIATYRGDIEEEILENFTKKVDEYDLDALDASLAKEFVKSAKKKQKENQNNNYKIFARIDVNSSDYDESNPSHVIAKYGTK